MAVSSVSATAASATSNAATQIASSVPTQATATSTAVTPHHGHKKHRPAAGQPGFQVNKSA